jgi:tRNA dimethylallyltransferase
MWQKGLLEEVQSLIPIGIREGKTSSHAIGYSQALAEIDGRLSREEAIGETARLTSRYARRQMSWFRRDPRINWFDYQDDSRGSAILSLVDEHIGRLG